MFTTHTVSTQLANSMKASQKSLTSGMYLTFYYLGGASGSFLPTLIYKNFGWDTMLYLFALMLIILEIFVFMNRKSFK
jgi:YNFM family putative membrane transporter